MSRTGSLRFAMLMGSNMTRIRKITNYFLSIQMNRRVSSHNGNNISTALIPFQTQTNNQHHSHNSHNNSLSHSQSHSRYNDGNKTTTTSSSSTESSLRINQHTQWPRTTMNLTTNFRSLASFASVRGTPTFGIAKDRSPAKLSRKGEKERDDTVIRHDAVYLKNCPNQSGAPDLKRKYKQTWNEFPQKRVRPATEWGYYGAPKNSD